MNKPNPIANNPKINCNRHIPNPSVLRFHPHFNIVNPKIRTPIPSNILNTESKKFANSGKNSNAPAKISCPTATPDHQTLLKAPALLPSTRHTYPSESKLSSAKIIITSLNASPGLIKSKTPKINKASPLIQKNPLSLNIFSSFIN